MKRGRIKASLTRPSDVVVEGVTVTHCKPFTNSQRQTKSWKRIAGAYGHVTQPKMGAYRGWRDVQRHDKQPIVTLARHVMKDEPTLIKG